MAISAAQKEYLKIKDIRDDIYLRSLRENRPVEFCVRGRSMYPFIKSYDVLKIRPECVGNLRIGDIVFIVRDLNGRRAFLTHRLVKVDKIGSLARYYTKGDNALEAEGPFYSNQIIAKVVSVKRRTLNINLESKFLFIFQRIAGLLSLRSPRTFRFINQIFCPFFLERRFILSKIIRRLKGVSPLSWNAQELAILLSKGELSEAKREAAIRLIKDDLYWEEFYRVVFESGKIVALASRLGQLADFIEIPADILKRLADARLKIICQTERAWHQLTVTLEVFSGNSVQVIPLKGTYLSEILYQDISLRGASIDIDLLIREKDKEVARMIMKQLGYRREQDSGVKKFERSEEFYQQGLLAVDLHWDITIFRRSLERIEGFWQKAKPVSVDVRDKYLSYYSWDDQALLLYLCLTLINNCDFRYLKYFFDIDALIRRSANLDWQAFISAAQALKINNSAYAGLLATSNILGTPVPGPVLDRLKPNILKRVLIQIFLARPVIFQDNMRRRFLDEFLSIFFFALLEAGNLRDYLKIAQRALFPPRELLETAFVKDGVSASRFFRPAPWQYTISLLKRVGLYFKILKKIIF